MLIKSKNNLWLAKPPLGSSINWEHPSARGLIGCWLFNERSGQYINNLVTPAWRGKFGSSSIYWKQDYAVFSGAQWIDFGQVNFLSGLNAVSAMAVFNITALPPLNDMDVLRKDGCYTPLQVNYDGSQIYFEGAVWPGGSATSFQADYTLTLNKFYTYVHTWDSNFNSGKNNIYVNAKKITNNRADNAGTGTLANPSNAMTFGATEAHNDEFYTGNLRLVYYWKRRLLDNEIRNLYENPYIFLNPTKRNRIFKLISSSGTNATATPSTAYISIKEFSATPLISKSVTVSPSKSLVSVIINQVTAKTSRNATATPSTSNISIISNSPTVKVSVSKTITLSTVYVTVKVNPTTASTNASQSSTASPATTYVSFKVNSVTPNVTVSKTVTVTTPTVKITIGQVSVTSGVQKVVNLQTKYISVVANSPTVKVSQSRIINLTAPSVQIMVFSPIASTSTGGTVTVYLLLNSKMSTTILGRSRMETTAVSKSRIDKQITLESPI